jgi:acyl-CoA thioester hydrolase
MYRGSWMACIIRSTWGWCKHAYIRELLSFDFETEARNGVYMVLSNFQINFLRSLKKDDEFSVTCSVFREKNGLPKLHFEQYIFLNKKIITNTIFSGTCVPATGGRPYSPGSLLVKADDMRVPEE